MGLINADGPKPITREKASKQSSVVKLCQYFGAHLDGHKYEVGICPILANPLTNAMAAARLTGGRGTLVLTHPRRRIPPRKVSNVRHEFRLGANGTRRCNPCTCQTGIYTFRRWSLLWGKRRINWKATEVWGSTYL